MVGGIYHGFNGVTMALNVILILETVDILNDYFQNKIKLFPTIVTLLAAILMSGWSELKVFIVELLIIVLVLMIISKKSFSTLPPGFDSYREVDLGGIRASDDYIMF